MDYSKLSIARRLKILMDAKGVSVRTLAHKLNLPQADIFDFLAEKNEDFEKAEDLKNGVEFIRKILRLFPDLSQDWLLTGSGPMIKPDDPFKITLPGEMPEDYLAESDKTKDYSSKPRRTYMDLPLPPGLSRNEVKNMLWSAEKDLERLKIKIAKTERNLEMVERDVADIKAIIKGIKYRLKGY